LAGEDGPKAYRAVWALASAPAEAASFLEGRLPAATDRDLRRLPRLIADLDSDRLADREKAQQAPAQLGVQAEPALRQTLAHDPTPEVRRRVKALLARADVLRSKEKVRRLRAIEALEHMGPGHARRALETLSRGEPMATETQQARAALRRL